MTCRALANRYLIVPLCQNYPDASKHLLVAGSMLEICLGLLAFGIVASFGLDDPTT